MNILMIGSHLRVKGGITRVIKNYIDAGLGENVNLFFFPTYVGSNIITNIIYFYLKLLILIPLLIIKRIDVAHIHMSYKGSYIRKKIIIDILERRKIPVVLHMHGSEFKKFFTESSESKKEEIVNTLNKVHTIIALGKEWKKFYKEISSSNVVTLDNAVFPKEDADYNLSKKNIITMFGLLSKRKGTYDLVDAVYKVKDYLDEYKDIKFLLAGNGDVEAVKDKIKSLGLQDRFIVPGWITDQDTINDYYKRSIFFVLPSYNEGMPMAILEAMSFGLPILSTKVGSISSVVSNKNGKLIDPGNIDELADSILEFLNHKDKLRQMSRENFELINEKYNIYNSINELVKIYTNIRATTD
jgi:glycosyltransferase involved in cell wall biosynthesis